MFRFDEENNNLKCSNEETNVFNLFTSSTKEYEAEEEIKNLKCSNE